MKFSFTGLAIACTLFSFNSQAQINKGQKMLGASINVSNNKVEFGAFETYTTTNALVQPSIGFGVGKNWIVGGLIGYEYTNRKHEREDIPGEDFTKLSTYSLGIWARKFYPLIEKFGIYGQGNLSAGIGKGKRIPSTNSTTAKADINGFKANIQPGFYFLAGKRVILEATFGTFGYTSTKEDYEDNTPYTDQKSADFRFSVTEGLSLGVKFIL